MVSSVYYTGFRWGLNGLDGIIYSEGLAYVLGGQIPLITVSWASSGSHLGSNLGSDCYIQMSRLLYLGTLAFVLCSLLRDCFKFEVDHLILLGQQLTEIPKMPAPLLQGLFQPLPLTHHFLRELIPLIIPLIFIVCSLWFCFFHFPLALNRQLLGNLVFTLLTWVTTGELVEPVVTCLLNQVPLFSEASKIIFASNSRLI